MQMLAVVVSLTPTQARPQRVRDFKDSDFGQLKRSTPARIIDDSEM